ncbi:hypothetical protein BN946_scf184721.g4 [Trametes cinnabarina]|uniref:Uncharacterized protein n=1 Tax=Pycnoporus cinnabarinus TaxID=5643 RepID=A0A060SIJ4_PYCCI|nr:hypothetical protein BN946_scf184721.g4 [Trametes cinnabarina]
MTKFSESGFTHHFAQTQQEACLAFAATYETRHCVAESQQPQQSQLSPDRFADIDFDQEPIPYRGDYFGPTVDDNDDDDQLDRGDQETRSEISSDEDEEPDDDSWEPEPAIPTSEANPTDNPADQSIPPATVPAAVRSTAEANTAQMNLKQKTYVDTFPEPHAGKPVPQAAHTESGYDQYRAALGLDSEGSNPWAPFASGKLRDGRSFADRAQRPLLSSCAFQGHEIVIGGESFEVYFRNIVECIKALFSDPEFAPFLLLVPERHYADADKTVRVYFEMNTGKWWWVTQMELDKLRPGSTVIMIIISSDKTQLTLIGNKSAYPVYMSLGNLPKDIRAKPSRRGQILLAYLPTTRLEHIKNKAARRRTLANLFHSCLGHILKPLASLGVTGLEIASGDGIVRRGHPILATYIGDYPEQLLVTGIKSGECPKCTIPRDDVGEGTDENYQFRDLQTILEALSYADEDARAFSKKCRDAGIKPIFHPFWEGLPFTNIFYSITPDVLHQLYQGVVKHLISWIKDAYGADEIDARCRRLPPNHNLRHFAKGISKMSRVTGKEHQDICRILLGLVLGMPLPGGVSATHLVQATRALLDFLYLGQYPLHTTQTLDLLDDAQRRFHQNKEIFCDLGIRSQFKLPKLHSLEHYRLSIELFGTTDNYDTQYSERLHIDFAKEAYRATNRKDEFSQMTLWLERREKVQRHAAYVQSRINLGHLSPTHAPAARRPKPRVSRVQLTRHPSAKGVEFEDAISKYGATYFRDALARFVAKTLHPDFTPAQVEQASAGIYFSFRTISAFHKLKFWIEDDSGLTIDASEPADAAHAHPTRFGKHSKEIPGRFDTVLVENDSTPGANGDAHIGIHHPYSRDGDALSQPSHTSL